jgi:hypothetical protein
MKSLIKFVLISLSLGLCLSAFSANTISKITYKWTDDKGIIQYTERPPKNRAYEKTTITASGGKEVSEVTQEEAESTAKDETSTKVNDFAKANERNCGIARKNLEVLSNTARVKVSDKKGESRILSVEEKQVREDDTKKSIERYCSKKPKT